MTAAASPNPLFSTASFSANAPVSQNAPSANALPRLQYLSIAGELLLLDITPVERMIMGFVLALEKANRRCFASNAYFAKLCNVSSSTTQRAVRHLVNRGLLRHFLIHTSGTQRLLSINTAHLEAEVQTALAYASSQALAGQPPKTMLAPDLRPKNEPVQNGTTTDSNNDSLPPPMTLEEEYLYRQMEKDLLYCRNMGVNVTAVVHHLEGQQVQALERVQQLVQTLVQEQVRVVEQQQLSNIKLSPLAPNNGDIYPSLQLIPSPTQEASHQNDEPPQQCDDAPRHFDDPIYTQFHIQKSLYKKQQGEENFASSEITSSDVVSCFLTESIGNEEENTSPVYIEGAVQSDNVPTSNHAPTSNHTQTSSNTHLNALQTTLSTLQTRANERVNIATHTSPSLNPKYTKPQAHGKPKKAQTFYQKQGQRHDEERRGVMTFQDLPHGTMFVWEGAANVYGSLRKLDDDHALRLENQKIIRVGNLQGRVEVQRR